MLYMVCPNCGAYLANKQIPFDNDIKKLCHEFGIETDIISRGSVINNDEFNKKRERIINKYATRYCCKMHLSNYCKLIDIHRGGRDPGAVQPAAVHALRRHGHPRLHGDRGCPLIPAQYLGRNRWAFRAGVWYNAAHLNGLSSLSTAISDAVRIGPE